MTDAVVLRSFEYGETSRILRLLTPDLGVQAVLAKGARRPRSRFSAVLEPFARGTATLHLKPGRELQTLAAFDLVHRPRGLGTDLLRFGGASLIAEILLRTASEEAHPGLFDGFVDAIAAIEAAPTENLEPVLLARTWAIVTLLGFGPTLDACVRCGRAFGPDEGAFFDAAAGGLRCADCGPHAHSGLVPSHGIDALRRFARGEPAAVDRTEGHWRLLARHLEHHILDRAPLRSLQFLLDALARAATHTRGSTP